MPKVSIIMPTYNQAHYIKKAIKSVLNQTMGNFELIIVNDGSTDQTETIIKEFDDPRIRYHFRDKKPNHGRGEYSAINFGLNKMRGRYFTWIHSDDIWPRESLQWRLAALQNGLYDLAHGDIRYIDVLGRKKKIIKAESWPAPKILNYYCHNYYQDKYNNKPPKGIFHHTTLFMKKDVLKKVGFWNEDLKYGGDLEWMLRVLKKCKIKYVPKVVYYYRVYKTNFSQRYKQFDTRQMTLSILDDLCERTNK